MLANVILMQSVTLLVAWLYSRSLLALCLKFRRGEETLLWAQVPAGLLVLGLSAAAYRFVLPHLQIAFFAIGIVFWSLCFWVPVFALKALKRSSPGKQVWLGAGAILALAAGVDAVGIEPWDVRVERVRITTPRISVPLRVLHLSDIQTSGFGPREDRLIGLLARERPDLVVLTGDYISGLLDRGAAIRSARRVLATLEAPLGDYAVSGDSEGDAERQILFDGLDLTWLRNEHRRLDTKAQPVYLVGLENESPDLDRAFAGIPAGAFTIVLHHSPDIVLSLGERHPDVVLAGHTHGGQVVLPLIGAPVTLTRLGSRYASGLFDWHGTALYVSRGIGLEGGFAPPIRFNCRPEVSALELSGRFEGEALPSR